MEIKEYGSWKLGRGKGMDTQRGGAPGERVQGWADAHVRPGGGRETKTLSLPLTPQGLQPLLFKSLKSSGPKGHISIFGLREDFLRV